MRSVPLPTIKRVPDWAWGVKVGDKAGSEASGLSVFWKFIETVRALPVHGSLERLSLLCAFYGAPSVSKYGKGASIAWIADRAGLPTEIARHHIRMLRADGAVIVSGRIGRTELFSLSEMTRADLDKCLSALDDSAINPGGASNLVTLELDEAHLGRRGLR
jgi:hypothetical protein